METKKCKGCEQVKSVGEYYTRLRPNGKMTIPGKCKECVKAKTKEWSKNNKTRKSEADRKWRENNKERKKENDRKWRENNKERKKETDRLWRENNKEHIRQYKKDHLDEHREKYKDKKREWERKRRATDPHYIMKDNLRLKMRRYLFSESMDLDEFVPLIGCTPRLFRQWVQFQFDSKMNWKNYSEYWHIEHVIPLIEFDLTKEEEQNKCFHWENTRPLEKIENLSKGPKIIHEEIFKQKLNVILFKFKYSI